MGLLRTSETTGIVPAHQGPRASETTGKCTCTLLKRQASRLRTRSLSKQAKSAPTGPHFDEVSKRNGKKVAQPKILSNKKMATYFEAARSLGYMQSGAAFKKLTKCGTKQHKQILRP
jgi:hypothetical protein